MMSVVLKTILLTFSYIYALFLELTIFFYKIGILRSYKFPVKVISIGNLTFGGTGKTPVEECLIKQYLKGKRVSLILRGYSSDELKLLEDNLKGVDISVGKDRVKAIKRSLKCFSPEVIILDDGFQHWRVKRDLDILLIDATCPFGNGRLMPGGILREPVKNIKRADIFFITRRHLGKDNLEDIKNIIKKTKPEALIVESEHKPLYFYEAENFNKIELNEVRGEKAFAFCGLGNPISFKGSLEKIGVQITSSIDFMDHHEYQSIDVNRIIKEAKDNNVKILVTTEKDLMRLSSKKIAKLSKDFKFYILKIEINILSGGEKLSGYLSSLFDY